MRRKRKFLRAASVLAAICSFIYFVLFAMFYSLSNYIYIMFLIFGIVSLYSCIEASCEIHLLPFDKKANIRNIINTVVSVIPLPSLLFNLLVRFYNKEDKYLLVSNPDYKEYEPKPEEGKKFFKRASFYVAISSFVLILLSGFSGHMFETNGGSVKVQDFTLNKQMTEVYCSEPLNGSAHVIENKVLTYGVTIYKPKTATVDNPAPVVFVMPGFTRTKATMSQYCIEFSKRGAVVFCIDPGCQGATTYSGYDENKEMISSTVESNGLNYLVHYVYNNTDNFNYIDRNRFGVIGHSAGGGNAVVTATEFAGSNYNESVIKALYISGYIKLSNAVNNYSKLHCNAAQSYAYYDEGAFRYQKSSSSLEVVNLRFINEVNGKNNGYTSVAYDYAYGKIDDGTMRIVHREKTNHCFEMYDPISIANTVNFFTETLDVDTALESSSQVWFLKELFNGLALAAAFTFILAFCAVLMKMPFLRPPQWAIWTINGTRERLSSPMPQVPPTRLRRTATTKLW